MLGPLAQGWLTYFRLIRRQDVETLPNSLHGLPTNLFAAQGTAVFVLFIPLLDRLAFSGPRRNSRNRYRNPAAILVVSGVAAYLVVCLNSQVLGDWSLHYARRPVVRTPRALAAGRSSSMPTAKIPESVSRVSVIVVQQPLAELLVVRINLVAVMSQALQPLSAVLSGAVIARLNNLLSC